VGVAVLDSRIRFHAINEALAGMNGLPASNHIGKKLSYVLGSAAPRIEGLMKQVLESGEPITDLELTAKLPGRPEAGHWLETYLPIRDAHNRVTQVAALVVELTDRRNLERSLSHLIGDLLQVNAALKTEQQFFTTTGKWSDETAGLLARAIELIDHCIGHGRDIVDSSRRYLSVDPPRPDPQSGHERWSQLLSQRERETLKLLADCKSNKEIAQEMNISVRTAETYRARIMIKLELPSIGHLIRFAVRNNIIMA
jgi:DNA-binding CsgD family transcriptional regulator